MTRDAVPDIIDSTVRSIGLIAGARAVPTRPQFSDLHPGSGDLMMHVLNRPPVETAGPITLIGWFWKTDPAAWIEASARSPNRILSLDRTDSADLRAALGSADAIRQRFALRVECRYKPCDVRLSSGAPRLLA